MNALLAFVMIPALALPLLAQDPATPAKPAEPPKQTEPQKPEGQKPEAPKVLQLGGRPDGTVTLMDIDGKPQKCHDLLGKLVVVNFYSIQCPIQAAWDKRLADIQKEFEAKEVVFLHIDSNVSEIGDEPQKAEGDAKPYANIRDHLKKKDLPFRVLVDHGNKIADAWDAKTTPHVYVFGKDGKLVYRGLVDDDAKDRNAEARKNYLRDVLGKLSKGEKVEPLATKEEGCSIKRAGQQKRGGGRGQKRGDGGGE